MNRREFTRLSSLALGATQLPAAKPVGYAAVGLGTISDIFMQACAQSKTSKITALVTGHPETKGRKYAALYGIPETSIYTYDQFDRLRENASVDAVYIGLPNSMHCDFTVRAAAAGKHVLCEKPMAISSDECRRMIAACKRADRKLMVAYRIQYDPTWNAAAKLLKSGELGRVESFAGGWYSQLPADQWRLKRALGGGGSLMDLGIYPLNAIRWLVGAEPTEFTAQVSTTDHASGRFNEVEQSVEWTMKWPSGMLAACGSSYGQRGPGVLDIHCENGWLRLDPAFYYDGARLTGEIRSGSTTRKIDVGPGGTPPFQFTLEADHFSGCIRNNTQPKSSGEDGLGDLLAIEAIYKAAGTPIA